MSALQIQIMRSIISMPDDKLRMLYDNIQKLMGPTHPETTAAASVSTHTDTSAGGVKVGLFEGAAYILKGHDIDECNDDISAMFGADI